MTRPHDNDVDSAIEADIESDAGSDCASEQSPLIPRNAPEIGASQSLRRRVMLMCVLCLCMVEVSGYIIEAPTQKIMEDIICRNEYPDHALRVSGTQDVRCKNIHVQETLAMVRGWLMATQMAAPMISQFPFGIIADKYGRRPVLFLALCSCFLATGWTSIVLFFPDIFSIWIVLPGSLFYLLGGGVPTAAAMVWTILSDVVPIAERATVFNRFIAVSMSCSVFVNPIAAFLLSIDPWLPMWLGLGFLFAGTLSALLIPETLSFRQQASPDQATTPRDDSTLEGNNEEDEASSPENPGVIKQAWFTIKNDMGHIYRFIFASKSIMMLIAAFSSYILTRLAMSGILLQYMTNRFQWDWSKATLVSTVGSVFNIICLLIVLPLASAIISRHPKPSSVHRDLFLTRASAVFTMLGVIMLCVADVPWLFMVSLGIVGLGSGFQPLCRALLTAVVEPHTVATLNTTISLMEVIIGLIGGPTTGWLLSKGIALGGGWMGLPFLVTAIIATAATAMVFAFRVPVGVAQAHEE